MPLFEYRCQECGNDCEIIVTSSESIPMCPTCGSSKLDKLLSVPSALSGVGKPSASESGMSCCGGSPDQAGCAGPGSCCGRAVNGF
jgi:putative FmdB family regulatory protein